MRDLGWRESVPLRLYISPEKRRLRDFPLAVLLWLQYQ